MTQSNYAMCERCGAAMIDLDKHNAWHRDLQGDFRNMNSSFNHRIDEVARGIKSDLRATDDRIDGVWPAIDDVRRDAGLPSRS